MSFIVRDHSGNVLHHARDANTFSPNRATAELRCLVWTLQSLKDLGYQDVVIGSDFRELVEEEAPRLAFVQNAPSED